MNIYNTQISFGLEIPNKISLNVYFSGCKNNKKCDRDKCHNKELHSFTVGENYTNYFDYIHKLLMEYSLIDCVCLLGGEPIDQNKLCLHNFLNKIRSIKNIDVYSYTGYDYQMNKEEIDNFLNIFKIKDIYVGHYSESNNLQYWLRGLI
jgi:hypothetical protein